ncbi:hypothetical protein GCM10009712_41340 [Pseudarthrobacter sulfonivorans]|uniref:hypothetical protein n=1 Tax=Pseudarthrobacter sulfonivorans TaxID=121292 RepID=UPI00168B6EEE|nr:hypothetical protein [Pseudarthrobacter sulfonivorans]
MNLDFADAAYLLTERLPAAGDGTPGGSNSLTPARVNHLPAGIKDLFVSSYNDALTPIVIWMVPLAVIAAVVLVFVKGKPLATALEHGVLSESISEGNILITADYDEPVAASR